MLVIYFTDREWPSKEEKDYGKKRWRLCMEKGRKTGIVALGS